MTIWRCEVVSLAIMPKNSLKKVHAYAYLAFLSSPVSTTTLVQVLALPALYNFYFLLHVYFKYRTLPRIPLPTTTLD